MEDVISSIVFVKDLIIQKTQIADNVNEKLIAKYKTDMDILQEQYKSQVESQEKPEKQVENWILYNDLLNTMDILKKHVKPMLKVLT